MSRALVVVVLTGLLVPSALDRDDGEGPSTDPDGDQLAQYLCLTLRLAVGVVNHPEQGRRAADRRQRAHRHVPARPSASECDCRA